MKILHTSDLHLNSPLTGSLPSDKARIRRRELALSLPKLISCAKDSACSAIIISGDLFDGEAPDKREVEAVLFSISESREISFFYLPGNHEGEALLGSGLTLPKNLFVFGKERTYFRAEGIVIAGRSRLSVDMYSSLELNPAEKNIIVLHGEPTDRISLPDGLGIKDAVGRGIDYAALGHYHTASSYRIDSRGVAVYCGSPFSRGFDECGDRGFILLDTEKLGDYKFVPLEGRRAHILEVNVNGASDYRGLISLCKESLSTVSPSDMVRLRLIGKRAPELWIDTEDIRSLLSEEVFYLEVADSTTLAINPQDYRYDKSLKGEFLRLVYSRDDLDELTKERVISTGLFALLGGEGK